MSLAPAFLRLCSDLVRGLPRHASSGALSAVALSLGCLSAAPLHAQSPGSVDATFTSVVSNVTVFTLALRMNATNTTQEVIVGGDTATLDAFNLDGSISAVPDPLSMATPPATMRALNVPVFFGGVNSTTYTQAFETTVAGTDVGTSDSRIFVAGLFGRYSEDANPSQNVRVINADGSIDQLFNPGGQGANGEVTAILPLDGGYGTRPLLIGGLFSEYNNASHNHLVRLNGAGTVDTAYNSNVSADDNVYALAQQIDPATGQPNGQILVGGQFNNINNTNQAKLARLNADGTLDTTFKPTFETRVFTILVQADGKILVGGLFNTINGRTANNIVRLNQDGTTDTSFVASITGNVQPVNAPPTSVFTIKRNPDGRLYVGGLFTTANGVARQNLARLEADGTLDTSFDPGKALLNSVQTIAIQSGDYNVLLGETRVLKPDNNALPPVDIVRLIGGPLNSPAVSTVSIAATIKKARSTTTNTGRINGQFAIVRTAPLVDPLTITFGASGAQPGTDYKLLDETTGAKTTGMITIPAGADHVFIDLVPKKGVKADATLNLTLTDTANAYTVDTSAATVKIRPLK